MKKIYAICHPKTGKPVYVGQTSKTLIKRLQQHLCSHSSSRSLDEWLKSLKGKKPIIELLEEVGANDAESREIFWIRELTKQSHRLLNVEFNHKMTVATSGKQVSAFVNADTYNKLKSIAECGNLFMPDLLRMIIKTFLEKHSVN